VEIVAGGSGNNGEIDVFPSADVLFIIDGSLEQSVHDNIKKFLSDLVGRLWCFGWVCVCGWGRERENEEMGKMMRE
jgi:hypothetical protein